MSDLRERVASIIENLGYDKYGCAGQIDKAYKEAGYVQLDENQELPRDRLVDAKLVDSKRMVYEADDGNFHCTAEYLSNYLEGYERAQQDMLEEGFRKVKGVKK